MVGSARIALGLLALFCVSVASAGVKVDYDAGADFSKYRTYAWKPGAPALIPEIEQMIVDTVDEELAADGLTRVEGEADLYVSTYAIGEEMAKLGVSAELLGAGFVLLKPDVRMNKAGTLLVRLADGASGEPVWHGWGSKTFGENPNRVEQKVGKVVRKMFREYPPR